MSRKVCFVYQWATYGGVERVFLNRAQAFESHGRDVEIEIHYGSDGGGLAAFNRTIREQNLEHRLRVTSRLDPARYDAVFIIDSPALLPQVLGDDTRWVMECHTPYPANRRYLANLPKGIDHLAVPSKTFANLLREEWPKLASRIKLLRNCVSAAHLDSAPKLPAWKPQPLLYFGRLDELKNPQGIIDLYLELDRRAPGRYFTLVVGPEVPGYDMASRIERAGLRGRIVQMPPLPFLKTSTFLAGWRELGGIMISPSFGESFGLAAAESIAAGIPVLLSSLPEHAELVGADDRHLYEPLDVVSGADKVEAMLDNYPAASERMLGCAAAFSNEAFLSDWDELMVDLGVASVPDRALNEEVGT